MLVLNPVGVVMGAAYRKALSSAAEGATAGMVMRFGVTTVRPSEQAADQAHRMSHAQVSRVVVTRPDGTLVGLFFAGDLKQPSPARPPAQRVLTVSVVPGAPCAAASREPRWTALARPAKPAVTEPEGARPSAQVGRSPARTSATACQSSNTRSTRSGDSATTASRNSPANALR